MRGRSVEFIRPELEPYLRQYLMIDDVLQGAEAVKKRGEAYLPKPNETDTTPENEARYRAYKKRAVFYNVTRRTLTGLIGQIFLRDPQVTLPTGLEVIATNANGEGVPLDQLASTLCKYGLAYGRGGLLVDYPTVENAPGGNSKLQIEQDELRPVLSVYPARDIINWRLSQRGARFIPSLIVLSEMFHNAKDGFETKSEQQFRVLRLLTAKDAADQIALANLSMISDAQGRGVEMSDADLLPMPTSDSTDVYKIEIWRKNGRAGWQTFAEYFPKNHTGVYLNEIPFMPVGSEKNDWDIDTPPLYDMADMNIGHYRNSADYEESVFIVGQPTPVATGLTQEWVQNVLKGNVALGARATIPLPHNADMKLLQAEPNTLAFEAMQHKERQMVALGARLVEQTTVQRTATEADLENSSDTSTLATIAKNVASAITWGLQTACQFTGDTFTDTTLVFDLNTEFDLTDMDFNERQETIKEWQSGAISFTEMRANLKRAGVATQDDKTAKAEIDADQERMMTQAMAQMGHNGGPALDPDNDGDDDSNPAKDPDKDGTKKAKAA